MIAHIAVSVALSLLLRRLAQWRRLASHSLPHACPLYEETHEPFAFACVSLASLSLDVPISLRLVLRFGLRFGLWPPVLVRQLTSLILSRLLSVAGQPAFRHMFVRARTIEPLMVRRTGTEPRWIGLSH